MKRLLAEVLGFSINIKGIFSVVPQVCDRFPYPHPSSYGALPDKLMGYILCQCTFRVPETIWIWNPPWACSHHWIPSSFTPEPTRHLLIRDQTDSTAQAWQFGAIRSALSQSLSTERKLLPPLGLGVEVWHHTAAPPCGGPRVRGVDRCLLAKDLPVWLGGRGGVLPPLKAEGNISGAQRRQPSLRQLKCPSFPYHLA